MDLENNQYLLTNTNWTISDQGNYIKYCFRLLSFAIRINNNTAILQKEKKTLQEHTDCTASWHKCVRALLQTAIYHNNKTVENTYFFNYSSKQ